MKFKHLLILLFFAWMPLSAQNDTTVIALRGYLGADELVQARKELDSLKTSQLIIEVNSTSGDLSQVLNLAKRLYELKLETKLKITVYIEDSAIGPAAIIPFLADKLYISLFVSWGDIALGSENVLSTNILRNRVVSLIVPDNPKAALFHLMASAMADKAFVARNSAIADYVTPGEPLVVNQNQLKQLKLVEDILPPEKFKVKFHLASGPAAEPSSSEAVNPLPERSVDSELQAHIKYDPKGTNSVGLITIGGHSTAISEATWLYVKTALDYYKKKKPLFIILELDTPGGEVFAAQKISDALKEMDTQYNIPVIAFINNWAISAGAMLAYSSRFISVVKDGSMGAAEPITMDSSGKSETASEKVNSALRADFANRASFFGRNPYIAEAMVDKDIILVLRHGKIIKLDAENQIKTTGQDRDIIISPKGKLLTLNAEQLINFGVADIALPPQKLEFITASEKEKGEWPASKALLFKYSFFEKIPNAVIDAYTMDWKTRFFVFLAHPVVSSLLFLGLMIGFYMEMNTPGFGLAGTLAVTCLFLIILSSFALELANWLELILLLTGLVIILVELFVLPTFGVLGFIGIIMFLAGLFGMMLPGIGSVHYEVDTHTLNAAGQAFFERLAWLCGTLVLAFAIILILARYVTPNLAGFSRFVLVGHEQEGYIAGDNPQTLPQPGARGEVISTLRPAGKVAINDTIYDAISPGSFIEKGEPIVVERLEGSVIVVNKVM